MVLQELSTPLPTDPGKEANGDGQTDGQIAEPKKKKRRKAETNEKSEGKDSAFPSQATAEKENMNDSIRRLYSQSVPDSLGARAERLGQDATAVRKAKEKAAMAAARREQGLSDPKSSGFAPEDRPEERLEDLGGADRFRIMLDAARSLEYQLHIINLQWVCFWKTQLLRSIS